MFVLRLTPPGNEVAEQVRALRFWNGRGTVELVDAVAGAAGRVDPVLMRGDIAFDLARVLWTRIDEMPDRKSILDHFDTVLAAAGIGVDHGRDWVFFRAVDYWLWGLRAGFTEDPERCRRLVLAFGN